MRDSHPAQADMFNKPLFESREAAKALDMDLFRLRIKTEMASAIKGCGVERGRLAMDMSRIMNASVSKSMLDAYTSPAKTHDISLVRFKALVRATGAASLWDAAIRDEGLLILQGDEPRLAEIARLQQEQKKLAAKLRTLRAIPVDIKRGR